MTTDPGIMLFGKKIGMSETPKTTNLFFDPETPSIDEETIREDSQTTDGDTMDLQATKSEKILPCPRCESLNTKFCYFNNSNVNQPRHFCKSCQRYWTAGGTMRSMQVGAGRRKKKNQPSNCHYVLSELELETESQFLSFGQNSPNFVATEKENKENIDNSVEKVQDENQFHSHFNWIPIPMPMMPFPPMYHPGYPQIPNWNSVSWLPPMNYVLGKHPADEEAIKPELKKQKNSILTPKTLRIHDPDEAAKSSIWATLGIKNEHIGRSDLFNAFQSKGNEKMKNKGIEPSPLLQANPAAFSRSLWFQERV